jgi:hypothetical protein
MKSWTSTTERSPAGIDCTRRRVQQRQPIRWIDCRAKAIEIRLRAPGDDPVRVAAVILGDRFRCGHSRSVLTTVGWHNTNRHRRQVEQPAEPASDCEEHTSDRLHAQSSLRDNPGLHGTRAKREPQICRRFAAPTGA